MTERDPASPFAYARTAGVLYLIIIVLGVFSEGIARASFIVPGDAGETAARVLGAQGLFRLGFAGNSIVFLADVALSAILYVLFRPVDRTLALIASAFRLAQASVLGLNLLNQHTALLILGDAPYLTAFEPAQLQAMALLFLDMHKHGYDLGLLYFGVHCLVLGYLILKATWAPRLLGFLMLATGVVYLVGSYVLFLVPDLASTVSPIYAIALLSEGAFCIWLLVKGNRIGTRQAAAA